MLRKVIEHPQSWRDKQFRKEFRRLDRTAKESCSKDLRELIAALTSDAHPVLDPAFRKWRPSAYRSSKIRNLIEYPLTGTMRVIVRFFEASPEREEEVVVLVAATLSHDHARLKRLIDRYKASLSDTGGTE